MKADNLFMVVRVKMKVSLLSAIKWRLMGFDKKVIKSQIIGDVSETTITSFISEDDVKKQS